MKTKEELNALKEEIETLKKKLAELTGEELEQVTGGVGDGDDDDRCPFCGRDDIDYRYSYRWCDYWVCPNCGPLTYFFQERRWEKGWIHD